ncbi:MAG: ATP-dependent DNA helicase [Eubacterium sp.]|nr:ATP-dependent DNA helicase [Eubacterium sp.]
MAQTIIELSVRSLVEFILRSGSIDSRFGGFDRAAEGARIHRKLQKEAGEGYQPEVSLSETTDYRGFCFVVRGRADGIFTENGEVVIDEIKTTRRSLETIKEDSRPVHFAQAKCYGYFYGKQQGLDFIQVQLTYYQVDTGEILRFRKSFSVIELEKFYHELLAGYVRWAEMQRLWIIRRDESIADLDFPYASYRRGQREMAVAVYQTIKREGRLFCQAPTGIGKTLSALFPSIKALRETPLEKIFYLTAKTITRQAAQNALGLMAQKGLRCRRVTLTAKDKICFLEERRCNPEDCPYAKDYFDRVGDVLYETLAQEESFTREKIEEICEANTLCPFEFALDLTDWCDVIVADYNYLFDPTVSLKRFFDETQGQYAFLIDEAHNLVDRSRSMYSASLKKSDFLALKRQLEPSDKAIYGPLKKVNQYFIELRKREEAPRWYQENALGELNELLAYFCFGCEAWQKKHPEDGRLEAVLELYFEARSYLQIADFYDECYRTRVAAFGSEVIVEQVCLDPAKLLGAKLVCGRASVFFSATLTPLDYFISVLGGDKETPRLSLPSPFDPARLGILRADTISTKYADREKSYDTIAQMIAAFVSAKKGNYLIYFPSYAYMEAVWERFTADFSDIEADKQLPDMDEAARENFLEKFDADNEKTYLGFCVLGGIYGEGIDLKGDRLIGTAIVGVGLPQVGDERNMLREYYDDRYGSGFDYAYKYPGMNKVLQALGRVIRDSGDLGMTLLIDSRFAQEGYRRLLPGHLKHFVQVRDPREAAQAARNFWAQWEKDREILRIDKEV